MPQLNIMGKGIYMEVDKERKEVKRKEIRGKDFRGKEFNTH